MKTIVTVVLLTGIVIAQTQSSQPPSASITNDDVLAMLKRGLSPDVVIAKIKASKCNCDTSPTTLTKLKNNGVPEAIIRALRESTVSDALGAKNKFLQLEKIRIDKIRSEPCAKDAILCIGPAPPMTVLADSAQLSQWYKLAVENKLEKSQVAKAIRFKGDNALMTAGEAEKQAGGIIKWLKKPLGERIVRIGYVTEAAGLVVKMITSSGKEVNALRSSSVPITSK